MRDPERLLHAASDADALEREVLRELRAVKAPAQGRALAWEGITAGIAAAGLSSAISSSAAAASAKAASAHGLFSIALGGAGRWLLLTALSGAALGGGLYVRRAADARATPAVTHAAVGRELPRVTGAASTIEAPLEPELAPTEERAAPATAHSPSPRAQLSRARADDRLAAESALLATARAQLRALDVVAAEASLRRLARRFPHGALAQEREVLAIELLRARGQNTAAASAARAFVGRYPNSPHCAQLRPLAEP